MEIEKDGMLEPWHLEVRGSLTRKGFVSTVTTERIQAGVSDVECRVRIAERGLGNMERRCAAAPPEKAGPDRGRDGGGGVQRCIFCPDSVERAVYI